MSIALICSFVHLFALNNLKLGDIPIDWGATFSGFMGLLFVGSIFVSKNHRNNVLIVKKIPMLR